MKKRVKIGVAVFGTMIVTACEDNICPDGQTPIRDPQGNLIDCFDPVNTEVPNQR